MGTGKASQEGIRLTELRAGPGAGKWDLGAEEHLNLLSCRQTWLWEKPVPARETGNRKKETGYSRHSFLEMGNWVLMAWPLAFRVPGVISFPLPCSSLCYVVRGVGGWFRDGKKFLRSREVYLFIFCEGSGVKIVYNGVQTSCDRGFSIKDM